MAGRRTGNVMANHAEQAKPAVSNDRHAPTETKACFTGLGLSNCPADVSLIVEFQIEFCVLLELMTDDYAAYPGIRDSLVKPISYFGADTDETKDCACFHRKEH